MPKQKLGESLRMKGLVNVLEQESKECVVCFEPVIDQADSEV